MMKVKHVLTGALALLTSSCCPIQLVLNAFGFGCAGFSVFTPYRAYFLALSIVSLTYQWIHVAKSSPQNTKSMAVFTVIVLLVAFSDRLIIENKKVEKHCIHAEVNNVSSLEEVKKIVTKIHAQMKNIQSLKTLLWKQEKKLIMEIELSEYISSDIFVKKMEVDELQLNAVNGWNGTFELSAPDQRFVHVKFSLVRCAGCYKAAKNILESLKAQDKIKYYQSQWHEPLKEAWITLSTTMTSDALLKESIEQEIIKFGKNYPVHLVSGFKYGLEQQLM